jgi:hypothetical protein
MRLGKRLYWPLAVPVALVLVTCEKSRAPTQLESDAAQELAAGTGRMPFAAAEVFFELNTTNNDLGLQIFLDADGWKRVEVADPRRRDVVEITADGRLAQLGITELRFESAEPSPAEVLAMFPPGDYKFRGRSVDGTLLASTATLSHDFLPAPTLSPSNGQVVDPGNAVVRWNAPGAERVEILIGAADLGHSFDVTVAGSITSLNVPPQFLAPGVEYTIEILAIAENGNRTLVESTFVTAGP